MAVKDLETEPKLKSVLEVTALPFFFLVVPKFPNWTSPLDI
jgi:hypothetical protein